MAKDEERVVQVRSSGQTPADRRKPRLYCYPFSAKGKSLNPYVENLMKGLSEQYDIVNSKRPSNNGVLDVYRYAFQCDVVLLNWVENVPDRRGGYFQLFLVYMLLIGRRVLGLKVAWVLHNKVSHTNSNAWAKGVLMRALARHADVIITHAREGVQYAGQLDPRGEGKTHFVHHPVEAFSVDADKTPAPSVDVLIWGSMHPYKGIREFLERFGESDLRDRANVLVWGRFSDEAYYETCRRVSPPGVEIRNEVVPDEALLQAQNDARVVLFPYSAQSILSSGALMTSLNSAAVIVGPDVGSFRDLAEEGMVITFGERSDMMAAIKHGLSMQDRKALVDKRRAFFEAHSWSGQCDEIARIIAEA